jgi:hypothetical protein
VISEFLNDNRCRCTSWSLPTILLHPAGTKGHAKGEAIENRKTVESAGRPFCICDLPFAFNPIPRGEYDLAVISDDVGDTGNTALSSAAKKVRSVDAPRNNFCSPPNSSLKRFRFRAARTTPLLVVGGGLTSNRIERCS